MCTLLRETLPRSPVCLWVAQPGPNGAVLFAQAVDADAEQQGQVSSALRLGCANLPWTNVLPQRGLNVHDILRHDVLALSVSAVKELEERLARPILR